MKGSERGIGSLGKGHVGERTRKERREEKRKIGNEGDGWS